MSTGIYVHIPFCLQKCVYCDFISYATKTDAEKDRYLKALHKEIKQKYRNTHKVKIDTIYFGGGTPTALPVVAIVSILRTIKETFSVDGEAEISIETNPETVDKEYLQLLRTGGFNRVSIGVQSLDAQVLQAAGRIHNKEKAVQAVFNAAAAGFDNISVDVICGLPKQTLENLLATTEELLQTPIQHLSFYGLKVEEGTPLADELASGRLVLPTEEEEDDMYEAALELLQSKGFERYEISNFAKSGYACRHNLKYWQYEEYLGFGISACSFKGQRRWQNTAGLDDYCESIEKAGAVAKSFFEELSLQEQIGEYVFLHLRTARGLDREQFTGHFGASLEYYWEQYGKISWVELLTKLAKQELLEYSDQRVWLTAKGMKFGNLVFAEFLL